MSPETVLTLGQQSLMTAAQIAAPLVLAGLAVGVLISMVQAATQIQEQSLLFVPKLVVVVTILGACGGWMMTRMIEYSRALILSMPNLIR